MENFLSERKCIIDSTEQDAAESLREKNFVFVDRTIQATIPLKIDFKKFCRLEIELAEPNERIHDIAKKSFVNDARFFNTVPPRMDEKLFEEYFAEMKSCYICRVKDDIAGFIEVVEKNLEGEIRLAAVDEKFRLSGAALSLYAGAADLLQQKNFKKLVGRISTKNMAVMNLYATLGANFSRPQDVYILSSQKK